MGSAALVALMSLMALAAPSQRETTAAPPDAVPFQGCYYVPADGEIAIDPARLRKAGEYRGWPIYLPPGPDPADRLFVLVAPGRAQTYELAEPAPLPVQMRNVPQFPADTESPLARNVPQVPLRRCVPVSPLLRDFPQLPPRAAARQDRGANAAPAGVQGVWIQYAGAIWRSAGPAVPFSAERFVEIGEYRGFPVYRERGGEDRIFLPGLPGVVAPYERVTREQDPPPLQP